MSSLNAWGKGSAHPLYSRYPTDREDIPQVKVYVEEFGFSFLKNHPADRWPTLRRALKNAAPAITVKIEWLERHIDNNFNYQQIFRCPGNPKMDQGPDDLRDELFTRLCDDIEETLLHGNRSTGERNGVPLYTCGGVHELLGRDPLPNDQISLRPYRKPVWRVTTYPDGSVIGEWICETSLEVVACEKELVTA